MSRTGRYTVWFLAATFALIVSPTTSQGQTGYLSTDAPTKARLLKRYGKLPLSFEANRGQSDNRVQFLSRGPGYELLLSANEATLVLPGPSRKHLHAADAIAGVRMRLVGSNTNAAATGIDELPGKTNYFIGNDPTRWQRNVPNYARVKYHNVYPGVDLIYYGNQSGQLEYDFVVAPGMDPNVIALSINGQIYNPSPERRVSARVDSAGDIVMHDPAGDIRFQKPLVYQERTDGRREYRDGRYSIDTKHSRKREAAISFVVGDYDHSRPLVIDPAITYSTFLSGTNFPADCGIAHGNGAAVSVFTDSSTSHTYAYVVGTTCALDFPTINAAQAVNGGGGDAFITKFDPTVSGSASVIYSTFLGGSGSDNATGVAVDSGGNAYISGLTLSGNFPAVNAYQSTLPCQYCGPGSFRSSTFLTKLSGDGSTLLYSTYFGGSNGEDDYQSGIAIAVDSAGHAYIAGTTFSSDLPLHNPFQATLVNNQGNAFVAGFDTTLTGSASLAYATYLGGPNNGNINVFHRTANAVAVDAAGTIHVAGQTNSNQFPVINGFQLNPSTGSSGGAFYSRLNPAASGSAQLLYSTYLGGSSGSDPSHVDSVVGIALDSSGKVYLTGGDASGVFPTTNSGSQSAQQYAFVAKIDPSLAGTNSLLYSTVFFTGTGGTTGIAVDGSGNAFVVGSAPPGLQLVNPAMGSANGVLQTVNGGQTWTGLTQGLTDFPILALAIDASTSPRTLYAGTGQGTLFVSRDGGLNWNRVLQVAATGSPACVYYDTCVMALAVDPTAPSNVYAGTTAGIYKSSDRGSTWAPLNGGLSSTAAQGILALQFDDCLPQCTAPTSATLYAGAPDGLYVLNAGATSWVPSTLAGVLVGHVAIDTRTSFHTVFTGVTDTVSGSNQAFRYDNAAATWVPMNTPETFPIGALGVDTQPSPSVLYGLSYSELFGYVDTVLKSVDEGSTWTEGQSPQLHSSRGGAIQVDTTTSPSTVYAMDPTAGVFKTIDGGNTWNSLLVPNVNGTNENGAFGAMAIDTTTAPSTIYVGTGNPFVNAFVAELNPSGSAFLFSTYLGGINSDTSANAIALDGSDNIYVTGTTLNPLSFPLVNAFQTPTANSGQGAFFTVLGSQTLPSSSSSSVSTQVGVQTGTVTVTLPNISGSATSSAPTLSVTPLSSTQTANFSLSNNLGAYDISTTASYSGSITICIQALTVNDPATFSNLQLFHIVGGQAVNVASSWDFSTRTVCGTVTSLSPFILFSPTTSTIVAGSLTPSNYGQPVTFTATVSAGGGTPTGTVAFYDGSNLIGTETLNGSGQAILTTAALSAGTHTISAVYGGNGQLLGSTSAGLIQVVNKAASLTVMDTSVSTSILNQSITLAAGVSAVVSGSSTPTGTITFYNGSTAIGTTALNANGQAMISVSSLSVGSHSLTAVYGGDSNFNGSTSSPFTQQVDYEPAGTTCLGAAGHQILQPINADGSSVWKGGSTVPAKFRVCDANGVSVGTAGVVSKFSLTQVIAGTVTSVDEAVVSSTPDAAFRWDSTNEQWIFNISTSGLTTGDTYVYTITLNDGSTIMFQYGLR